MGWGVARAGNIKGPKLAPRNVLKSAYEREVPEEASRRRRAVASVRAASCEASCHVREHVRAPLYIPLFPCCSVTCLASGRKTRPEGCTKVVSRPPCPLLRRACGDIEILTLYKGLVQATPSTRTLSSCALETSRSPRSLRSTCATRWLPSLKSRNTGSANSSLVTTSASTVNVYPCALVKRSRYRKKGGNHPKITLPT